MKKILTTSLLFLFLSYASAQTFIVSGIRYSVTLNNAVSVVTLGDSQNEEPHYSGNVIIPSTVVYLGTTYNVTSISDYAFSLCRLLTTISIPNTVKTIGRYAFNSCIGLTTITIPNSVTSIEPFAFSKCFQLKSIVLSNSMKKINESTFEYCQSLTSVVFPNSLENIGVWSFYQCLSLTNLTIPDSVTSISDAAFRECSGLITIKIPNSVTFLGDFVFGYCSSLNSIEIPNSISTIGSRVFEYCTSLKTIILPNSLIWITGDAFQGSFGIESVTVNAITPPTVGLYTFSTFNKSIPLNVPKNSVDLYKNAFGWKDFLYINGVAMGLKNSIESNYYINISNRNIKISNVAGKSIGIFEVSGRKLFETSNAQNVEQCTVSNQGVYFISIDNVLKKIIVN